MSAIHHCGRRGKIMVWLSGAGFALACGCITYHHELGSTHVAVLSVTRWDDYVEQLAPGFDVNANSLKAEAVSDSLQREESVQHAFSGRLGLSLAGGGDAAVPLPALTTNSVPTATPASLGPLALPGNALNRGTLVGDRFLEYLAATALFQEVKLLNRYVLDAAVRKGYGAHIVRLQVSNMPYNRNKPFDTYANLAFFMSPIRQRPYAGQASKEIRAYFERSVGSAKQTWDAKNAELLRAENDVQTEKEKLARLGRKPKEWATEVWEKNVIEAEKVRKAAERTAAGAREDYLKQQDLLAKLETFLGEKQKAACSNAIPVVIPLLVTDQVEAALVSRKMETLRQLTLSLAAAYAGQGAKLDLEDIDRKTRTALGRDYNSLFTVARLADNALRVRIGARQTLPEGEEARGYATIPQTHNVTLLLLVPQKQGSETTPPKGEALKNIDVFLGLKTEYRDPCKGTVFKVEPMSSRERQTRIKALAQDGGYASLSTALDNASNVCAIAAAAQNGQYESYLRLLGACNSDNKDRLGEANRLWLDLVCAHIGSDYDVTQFEVEPGEYKLPQPFFPNAEAFLLDDGQTTTATVNGVRNLDVEKAFGMWEWWLDSKAPAAEHRKLASSSVRLNGKRQLVLTFPSLLKNALARPGQVVKGKLCLTQGEASVTVPANATLAKTPDPNHLEILSTTEGITMNKGVGQVELLLVARGPAVDKVAKAGEAQFEALAKNRECFVLSVRGAEANIVPDAGKPVPVLRQMPASLNYLVAGTGKVKFELKNPSGSGTMSFDIIVPSESDPVAPKNFKVITLGAPTQAVEK